MKITKNGFYKLSEINSEKIIIEDNLIIAIFDDLNNNYNISIGENSKVEIFGVLENKEDFKLKIIQEKNNSVLKLNYLLLSKNDEKINAKIESIMNSNFVKSDVKIISIVGNGGKIDLDGIIKIEEGIEKVDGNLSEENIFLGDNGIVKGIPTLLVGSSDVKASHSCKIERISDEKLFYLRSRGFLKENALDMIIEAKIENIFSGLKIHDKNFYEEVLKNTLNKI